MGDQMGWRSSGADDYGTEDYSDVHVSMSDEVLEHYAKLTTGEQRELLRFYREIRGGRAYSGMARAQSLALRNFLGAALGGDILARDELYTWVRDMDIDDHA